MKLIIIFLIISSTVFAQYTITKSVLGNGGESLQNSNYKVNATIGQSIAAEIYFLAGILVLAITLAPITTATALRIRLS